MKTDVSVAIAALLYAGAALIVMLYVMHSLATATMQVQWVVEEMEILF
ncbi:MAG: hypothetical protein ACREQ7_19595 [Candidatus Binatia bacterium]